MAVSESAAASRRRIMQSSAQPQPAPTSRPHPPPIPISFYPATFLPLPSPLFPPFPSHFSLNHLPPAYPCNPLGTANPIYPSPTPSPAMGNCASTTQEAEGKARSDMIDRQIEEDSKRYKRECKILLLGACATPVLCPSEGNREGKKSLSEGMFPFLHDRCHRRVWRRSLPCHGIPYLSHRRRTTRAQHRTCSSSLWMPAYTLTYSLTRTPCLSDRFRRVRKVYDSQANEDHSPERLLS